MQFSLANFLFHVTTAYALLRAKGVPLGKMDFLAGGRCRRPPEGRRRTGPWISPAAIDGCATARRRPASQTSIEQEPTLPPRQSAGRQLHAAVPQGPGRDPAGQCADKGQGHRHVERLVDQQQELELQQVDEERRAGDEIERAR